MAGLSVQAVFDVLRDGYSYGDWVVGARTVRAVDDGWPREGTRVHYTVGRGPLRHDDKTVALSYDADRRLELEAHGRPFGTARIVVTAEAQDDGALVSIDEAPHSGVGRTLHNPVFDLLIKVRNVETLRRLEAHARGSR